MGKKKKKNKQKQSGVLEITIKSQIKIQPQMDVLHIGKIIDDLQEIVDWLKTLSNNDTDCIVVARNVKTLDSIMGMHMSSYHGDTPAYTQNNQLLDDENADNVACLYCSMQGGEHDFDCIMFS